MSMNPYSYYSAFVEGNYDDFCNEPNNVRKGINAAVSAFHMADQYFYYYKRNDPNKISQFKDRKDFLKYLSNKTKYFIDIESIANVYKHLYSASHMSIDSAGCIESIIFKKDKITIDGCGEDDEKKFVVVYTTKDSKKTKLMEALNKVVNMWSKILLQTT